MMIDYNNFAKTFSKSRKKMKWEEIDYFISFLKGNKNISILDIGCGNGRFLGSLIDEKIDFNKYLGIDLSIGLLNEAKKIYPKNDFLELNMLDLNKLEKNTYDYIFLIASFHHLNSIDDRLNVLKNIKKILKNGGTVFMTNWSLNSDLNNIKYKDSIMSGTKNEFNSLDYSIKIGKYKRYYHGFNLKELEFLFKKEKFNIIENKEFENKKNIISIITN